MKHQPRQQDWILRWPLQIESLRQELLDSEANAQLLRKLQQSRENLDAVIYALSNRNLAANRREHLVEMLRRHQRAVEECFRELGVPVAGQGRAPLWYFNQLEPIARAHLAAILGVPEEPPFYEILDIKAEEYLAQHSAFQALAKHYGFKERDSMARHAKRSALLLTLSGSLVQLSEPISSNGARRYLYQNIYGNAHPPEGTLVLDRDLCVGHRVRAVELTTSPVRLLRIVGRRVPWKAQSQTFARISRTLRSLVGQSSSRLPALSDGPLEALCTGQQRLTDLKAADRVYRDEYGEALARFAELRHLFADSGRAGEDDGRKIEAELLALCHYLQTGARELGFESCTLDELREFVTQGEHLYRLDPSKPGVVTLFARGQGPEILFVNVTVGRQVVTCGAPLTLIGGNGEVIEVTLPVERLHRR